MSFYYLNLFCYYFIQEAGIITEEYEKIEEDVNRHGDSVKLEAEGQPEHQASHSEH